jgi:hypothetical protein
MTPAPPLAAARRWTYYQSKCIPLCPAAANTYTGEWALPQGGPAAKERNRIRCPFPQGGSARRLRAPGVKQGLLEGEA